MPWVSGYSSITRTPRAETCIAYCRTEDIQEDDAEEDFGLFRAWFQGRSIPFLEDALVDYNKDKFGGQLTIKAPNAKMPRVNDDSPVEDRINYILYNEVNPSLAAHGGEVSLVEVTSDQFAILQFGGGARVVARLALHLRTVWRKPFLNRCQSWLASGIQLITVTVVRLITERLYALRAPITGSRLDASSLSSDAVVSQSMQPSVTDTP